MNNEQHADMAKWLSIVIGVGCILTILFAPLGVWIIIKGLRRARVLREMPAQESFKQLSPEEWGLIQSWDDMPD